MGSEFMLEQVNRDILKRRPRVRRQDVDECLEKFVKQTKKNVRVFRAFEQAAGDEIMSHCNIESINGGVLKLNVRPGPYMFSIRSRADEIIGRMRVLCPSAHIREIKIVCSEQQGSTTGK